MTRIPFTININRAFFMWFFSRFEFDLIVFKVSRGSLNQTVYGVGNGYMGTMGRVRADFNFLEV